MNTKIIYYAIKDCIKKGKLELLEMECKKLIKDFYFMKAARKSKNYIDNFFIIETFIDINQECFEFANIILQYLSNLPKKKYNRLALKSKRNSEKLSRLNNINY